MLCKDIWAGLQGAFIWGGLYLGIYGIAIPSATLPIDDYMLEAYIKCVLEMTLRAHCWKLLSYCLKL